MILADTSGLFSALDRSQPRHHDVSAFLSATDERLVLSPFVLAELDYLVQTRLGTEAELLLLEDVAAGAYELASFTADDVAAAESIVRRHADAAVGLADASIVVLAERFDTDRVLTLDERHFRALRGPRRRPFRLLPADL